ncbi:MAG: NADH-quinone oxidoreductase subunit A [Corynebacterium sp.]|nr:NADH-quinone oxidoreductase subunit A [Corynebacterium sp.]
MNYYIPILALFAVALAFVIVMIIVSVYLGPHRYNRQKFGQYECGVDTTAEPITGMKFSAKYFTVAMMFILFDVETIFLYPWAVSFNRMGWFMVVEILLFVITLLAAYAYVWRRGGLTWE